MALLISLSLFSCSNTDQSISYYQSDFEKTVFVPMSDSTMKKPLRSDHQLMMSLLNRPITADQAMMLAFSQQKQIEILNSTNLYVNYVSIKGEKAGETTVNNGKQTRPTSIYSTLIASDINAISIMAPL